MRTTAAAALFAVALPLHAQAPPVKADTMTEAQMKQALKTAPDTQVFEYRGQKLTAGELKAKQQREDKHTRGALPGGEAFLQDVKQKGLQKEKAKFDEAENKAHAGLQGMKTGLGGPDTSQTNQLVQLYEQYKTAPPDEKNKILERAGPLLPRGR